MDDIKYSQKTTVGVPNFEFYVMNIPLNDTFRRLEDARRFLGKWGFSEDRNGQVTGLWRDAAVTWVCDLKESYKSLDKFIYDNEQELPEKVNNIIVHFVQHRFSEIIRESMQEDFDLIANLHYIGYDRYIMRDRTSKGIVVLQEPSLSSRIEERGPNLDFEVKATDEVNLSGLREKIKDYVVDHWNIPYR